MQSESQYDNKFIDIISHNNEQTAFSDIAGFPINDYMFLINDNEIINTTYVSKFGINLAKVVLLYKKIKWLFKQPSSNS